ncbi:MAG TPA: NADH-quinone oxidoreductase subunit J [Verrucomicrobiae bacterium]|nr:NADH-quinone oxidoreductase subunit J [Verrucomicrobiae bacterium]
MDSLHAIGFYVSSGVSLAGALGVALMRRRDHRGLALAVVGVGLAGLYLTLSAGFAAAVALLCYLGAAWLLAGRGYRAVMSASGPVWRQAGAVGAGGLLVLLAYSAFRGGFVNGAFRGGTFGTESIGRLFFGHDALATEAVALLVVAALAGATAAWRARERQR